MYKKLLRSFVLLFLDRGYSVALARVQGSFALAVWLIINAASLMLLTGPEKARKIAEALPQHTLFWSLIVLVLSGLNWLVARSLPPQMLGLDADSSVRARRGRGLWLWYVIASGLLLVLGMAVVSR